jgi:hypothetical protein
MCRTTLLVAPDDPWWPEAHTARARSVLPADAVDHDSDMMHAFCVSPQLSDAAAGRVEHWARAALARHDAAALARSDTSGGGGLGDGSGAEQRRCEMPLQSQQP